MSQYTTSTETVKSEDTTEDESASIFNDPRSSGAQSSVEDILEILNAPSQTTSPNQAIEFEVYLGPDHVQVFWKHKSIGNQASDWLT